jgi:2-oxoglutarate ferredoxin oxidoreductase subunit beta
VNTYDFYKERVYKLEEAGHDMGDLDLAYQRAGEWGERIPIGVLYRADRPTYMHNFPVLQKGPLVRQRTDGDTSDLLKEFM